MGTLSDLFLKYNTDKDGPGGHSYAAVYEEVFGSIRNKVTDVLELGVLGGASLRAWQDYFPNADITGLDIDAEKVGWATDRIFTARCDVTEADQLNDVLDGQRFDIIIDDASHWESQQLKSFELLVPRLRPGGIYVVEDIQCDCTHEALEKLGFVIYDRRPVKGRVDDVIAFYKKLGGFPESPAVSL